MNEPRTAYSLKNAAKELGVTLGTLCGRIMRQQCPLPNLKIEGHAKARFYDEPQFALLREHFAEYPQRFKSKHKNRMPMAGAIKMLSHRKTISDGKLMTMVLERLCDDDCRDGFVEELQDLAAMTNGN